MKFDTLLAIIVVGSFGVYIGVTGWWTLTGHCCGSPLSGADWDSCLPYGDKLWPERVLMTGHCDRNTWKRVTD